MVPKGQYFRANTGIVVVNSVGEVLILERSAISGAWQFPQGGLQVNEDPLEAAKRELREETGITDLLSQLIAEYPDWLAYELPPESRSEKTGRGQVQKWFVFRFTGQDVDIMLDQEEREFSSFQWVKPDEAVARVVGFRQEVYRKVVDFLYQHQLAEE